MSDNIQKKMHVMRKALVRKIGEHPFVQLAIGIAITVSISLAYVQGDVAFLVDDPNAITTLVLSVLGTILALFMFRRAEHFPGVGIMANVFPAVTISFGVIMVSILALRLDYGRIIVGATFVAIAVYLAGLGLLNRKPRGQAYYLVPSENTHKLAEIPGIRWIIIDDEKMIPEKDGIIIADLRLDLDEAWERRITEWVLSGHQVFHSKQVFEAITGRVQIEHLSENSLGSLAPSESYSAIKRVIDIISSLLFLPILIPLFLFVAILVKLDSRGPVFFKQDRVGYRGQIFSVIKFRTMRLAANTPHCERAAAKTSDGDNRITRLGALLRRTRIDELPQVVNVLRGQMSWIGPRPEAVPLSEWYTSELPYYSYRHIVRPGVTGWAQVNQGHVTELDEVLDKLHYDFYYIKKFSGWIDLAIIMRTVATIFSGAGAR